MAFLFVGCNKPLVNHEARISESETETLETNNISVVLKINNDQFEKETNHVILKGKTVFEFMKDLAYKEEINFIYKESNVGVFVKSINGVENNVKNNTYWMFYVNDEMSNVGVGGYVLLEGDVVSWKYIDVEGVGF